EFDPGHRLLRAIEAERAELESDRRWRLVGVRIKDWSNGELRTETRESLDLGPFWSAAELPVLGQSTAAMSPGALYRYAEYLHDTGQDDAAVRMAFWQKATLPVSAASMVFLCAVIGIGFGSTRSAAFGLRVVAGAAIGVAFYLLTQIFHTGGQLLGLPQALVVMLPIGLVVLAGIVLARHTRGPR
ncbi:MAG: LptF/LptG family permease, partial [Gammaproteobacteria bacterium]